MWPWRPGLDSQWRHFYSFFCDEGMERRFMVSATSSRSFTSIPEVWRRRGTDVEHRCICQKLFGFQLFWFCPQNTFPFTATSLNVPLLARATPGRHAVQQRGRARVRGRTGAITRERPDSRPFPATDAPTVVNPDENLTLRSAPPRARGVADVSQRVPAPHPLTKSHRISPPDPHTHRRSSARSIRR